VLTVLERLQRNTYKQTRIYAIEQGNMAFDTIMSHVLILFDDWTLGTSCVRQKYMRTT